MFTTNLRKRYVVSEIDDIVNVPALLRYVNLCNDGLDLRGQVVEDECINGSFKKRERICYEKEILFLEKNKSTTFLH